MLIGAGDADRFERFAQLAGILIPNKNWSESVVIESAAKVIDLLSYIEQIERLKRNLRTNDYHLLAIAHHKKQEYLNAIPFYKKYLAKKNDAYGYTNLSLAYSSTQVGQDLDAADCCHLALIVKPGFEKADSLLSKITPKLEKLKEKVKQGTENNILISNSSWFEVYVSPFELLQLEEDEENGELEIKEIQKAKKLLLQEIELEDGSVEWIAALSEKWAHLKLSR